MLLQNGFFDEELELRFFSGAEDLAEYYKWLHDYEVNKYLEVRHSLPNCPNDLADYINKLNGSPDNLFMGIIVNNKHIGNIKVGNITDIYHRADVGILIGDKSYWGKGYGVRSIELVKKICFQHLNLIKIQAGCYASNLASLKIFLKAGFKQEGYLENYWTSDIKSPVAGILLGCSIL